MQALWETHDWLIIREIGDRMDYPPVAYTTVATVTSILCGKGLLQRHLADRAGHPGPPAWQYRAARSASEHIGELIAALLDHSPSPADTLAHALSTARTALPLDSAIPQNYGPRTVDSPARPAGEPEAGGPLMTGQVVNGHCVRELRRAHRLTQRELAAKVGIVPSVISRIENGQAARPGCLANLAAVFGLSVDDLLVRPALTPMPEPGLAALVPTHDRKLWTAAEVALVLGASMKLVYRLVRAGELEARRVGGSLRIPAASVRAYLASQARRSALRVSSDRTRVRGDLGAVRAPPEPEKPRRQGRRQPARH